MAGLRGRSYAESAFDTGAITDRFEHVIETALSRRGQSSSTDRQS
jgi:hypothetical protein